jgi:hypothetical protein
MRSWPSEDGETSVRAKTRWSWVWFVNMLEPYTQLSNHCIRIDKYDDKYETVISTHVQWKTHITLTTPDHPLDDEMMMLLGLSKFLVLTDPGEEYRSELKMWR